MAAVVSAPLLFVVGAGMSGAVSAADAPAVSAEQAQQKYAERMKLTYRGKFDDIQYEEYWALTAEVRDNMQRWVLEWPDARGPGAEDKSDWLTANGGKLDRADGPASIERWRNGNYIEDYRKDGEHHRDGGPAMIEKRPNGTYIETWYQNGRRHRDGGPAVTGTWKNGKRIEQDWKNDELLDERITRGAPAPASAHPT